MKIGIELMEQGLLPDRLIRIGIRRLLERRLREQAVKGQGLMTVMSSAPIALHTDKANAQHYELPPEFFSRIMGRHLKYSAGYWPAGVNTLDKAEEAMLELSCRRARLDNHQSILELGCGWGSLTLWMAEHYPASRITAVSNSKPQGLFVEAQCRRLGIDNVRVITADMNDFDTGLGFDRVVSVEMFEHMRNWPALLARIDGWLRPGGKLFVHVFSHRCYAYPFETSAADDWMGRYFFTGGLMPSHDLLPRLRGAFRLEEQWRIGGCHYWKTAEAWLANHDRHREEILALFHQVYGADARRWFWRWRVFFMACAELFGYRNGREWGVSQYRLAKGGEDAARS